ncbi:hypothetical protein Trydic_g14377 [Trypoxylus dichotomus]
MSFDKKKLPKLDWEFVASMRKDGVKVYLLPAQFFLRHVLCWPDDELPFGKVLGWSLFWMMFLTEIFHATYMVIHIKDISDAVSTSATVTTTLEASVRLYIMLKYRGVINAILVKVWKQFWPINCVNEDLRKRLRRKVLISVILTTIFFASSVPCNVIITTVPFLGHHQLVLRSSFPFNWNRSFIYEALYVFQYFIDWYVLFTVNAFDFFFVSLLTICATQYSILQDVIERILSEHSNGQRKKIFGESGQRITDRKMLYLCLEQHKLLNSVCSEMESSFNMAILIQFIVSICANCGPFLIMKIDYSQFSKMLLFACCHLTQLFYYCYVGQEISYQSEQTASAIYACDWHLSYDREFRKSLLLMLQRSQKTQYMTAAGLIPLDYASFVRILRLTFSFYTLLDKFLEKENE